LGLIVEFKNLHWFYDNFDVIISEIITKGNSAGSVPPALSESIDTTTHKSLDNAIGQIVKILTEKTNELQESFKQAARLTEDDHMEVTGKDNSSHIPGILRLPSAFKVVDEYVD